MGLTGAWESGGWLSPALFWGPEGEKVRLRGVETPATWPQHHYLHRPAEVASWQVSTLVRAPTTGQTRDAGTPFP